MIQSRSSAVRLVFDHPLLLLVGTVAAVVRANIDLDSYDGRRSPSGGAPVDRESSPPWNRSAILSPGGPHYRDAVRLPIAARQIAADVLVAIVVAVYGLLVATDAGSLLVLWWLDW
jgi:hypothetical protein